MSAKASVAEGKVDTSPSKTSDKNNDKDGSNAKRRSSNVSTDSADTKSTKQPPEKQASTLDENQEVELTKREKKIKAAKRLAFSLLKSCSTNLCLLLAVIGYAILGGFLFNVLEEQNEREGCFTRLEKYNDQEAEIVQRLKDIANGGGDTETTSKSYKKLLGRFRKIVYEVDYTGDNCSMIGRPGGPNLEWSISGATMFAVTITTSVGYGNISPKTFWGKMVCIAYAILGIPLMLLFLANIGDVLADAFRFFYTKICCCGCLRARTTRADAIESDQCETPENETEEGGHEPPRRGPIVAEVDDDDDDLDDGSITIPVTITLAVMGSYVMLGSLLFGLWEDWSAAYFSFITLSTIGFGDFVPGKDGFDDPYAKINILTGAVYIIVGMAILSMCFALIQDEITAKFAWVCEKLGFKSKTIESELEENIA